jgi:3-methyladenine DNA glycosylase AlkD
MTTTLLSEIRQQLKNKVDESIIGSEKRFFKEEVKVWGVPTKVVGGIAKSFKPAIKNLSPAQVYAMCEQLLAAGYLEEAWLACEFCYLKRDQYQSEDFAIFAGWLEKYVTNWATCDTFCNHSLASFIEKYPVHIEVLKKWTQSDNRWLRRASAVTFILPARQGKFAPEIFEIADLLLLDTDDLVQKGYGWMLKALSESKQQAVFDFVTARKAIIPRTALRYAIEKMPVELKKQAMAK